MKFTSSHLPGKLDPKSEMPGRRIVAVVATLLAWAGQASSSVCEAMEEHASCGSVYGATDVGGITQLQSAPDLWATECTK